MWTANNTITTTTTAATAADESNSNYNDSTEEADPEVSTPLKPKPTIEHDSEPVLFSSDLRNLAYVF
jgi:hypothetical protein